MLVYAARKYFVRVLWVALALCVLPALFGAVPARELLPTAWFWSSFLAAWVLHREFERHGLWPLYDNLRLSKRNVVGTLVLVNATLAISARLWLL